MKINIKIPDPAKSIPTSWENIKIGQVFINYNPMGLNAFSYYRIKTSNTHYIRVDASGIVSFNYAPIGPLYVIDADVELNLTVNTLP